MTTYNSYTKGKTNRQRICIKGLSEDTLKLMVTELNYILNGPRLLAKERKNANDLREALKSRRGWLTYRQNDVLAFDLTKNLFDQYEKEIKAYAKAKEIFQSMGN